MKKYLIEYNEADHVFDFNAVNDSARSFSHIPFDGRPGYKPVALVGERLRQDGGFVAFIEHLSACGLRLTAVCIFVNLWLCNAADSRRQYFENRRLASIGDAGLPYIISLSD